MNKKNEQPTKSKHPPKFWWDFDLDLGVGIECDDKSLTFDGHFVCMFPQHEDEKDASGAIERAERVLKMIDPQWKKR